MYKTYGKESFCFVFISVLSNEPSFAIIYYDERKGANDDKSCSFN